MALCKQEFSATQFALLSALSAEGRTYLAGPLTPPLVESIGWPGFFMITVLIALPGLILLRLRKAEIEGLDRSEEHTSELQSLMRISYAVFCLKKKKIKI